MKTDQTTQDQNAKVSKTVRNSKKVVKLPTLLEAIVIVMEYQGRRAAITCHDHYPVTCIRFYPNYPWTTPLPPSEREGHYIDFQVLALNAVTAYLKLMPTLLWEEE